MGWTDPTTRATGELITAVDWNTDLTENLKWLHKPPAAQIYSAVTTTTVPKGAPTTISLGVVSYDTDSMTGTANTITIKTAGVYSLNGTITWDNAGTSVAAVTWGFLGIAVNGTVVAKQSSIIGGSTIGSVPVNLSFCVTTDLPLSVNDAVTLVASNSYTGGSTYSPITIIDANVAPRLSVHRVSGT